ncbi:MAG TPA: RNA polymerase sigma factor [Candidatus Saccharibacteria bacterium]|nr:RNA polymerase sigma factor [Candidatus Saccharibacteria bacterium]HRK94058.1 RNA polymerase sigma factor [Candidatus Saccharibacteria bacterium]
MQLEAFYDEHVGKVYKFFYIKSLNKATAEDLTSDTFISFMEQAQVQAIEDQTKYLYGIMRNIWLQFLRSKYQQAMTDVEGIEDFASHVEFNLDQFDEAKSADNRLMPYIEELPSKQREVLIKRLIEEKSISEVAEELGKDKNYVKTTYHRALTTLRARLANPYMEGTL